MKNTNKIAIFIDASNIWHCQKENSWRIDFYQLKKYFKEKGEIVGLYYFTPKIKGYEKFKVTLDKLNYTVIYKPLNKKITCICNKTSLSVEIKRSCHNFINLTNLRKKLRYKKK